MPKHLSAAVFTPGLGLKIFYRLNNPKKSLDYCLYMLSCASGTYKRHLTGRLQGLMFILQTEALIIRKLYHVSGLNPMTETHRVIQREDNLITIDLGGKCWANNCFQERCCTTFIHLLVVVRGHVPLGLCSTQTLNEHISNVNAVLSGLKHELFLLMNM